VFLPGKTFRLHLMLVGVTSGLYYKNVLTIVSDACTINVLHLTLSLCLSLS
jgi:hypothetical protein